LDILFEGYVEASVLLHIGLSAFSKHSPIQIGRKFGYFEMNFDGWVGAGDIDGRKTG